MVTRINDRKIVHLCCGADFIIAMDSEGVVWAWGRNDSGQVGKNIFILFIFSGHLITFTQLVIYMCVEMT